LVIYFSTDGSDPLINKNIYSGPIHINETTILKAISEGKNKNYSKVVTAKFNKIPEGKSIKINTKHSHTYTADGDIGLIDNIRGTSNFHTAWQGYEGVDFDAVVDLGRIQKISSINSSFLQNTGSWIFFPVLIEYYISTDGNNFTKIYETKNIVNENYYDEEIKNFKKNLDDIEARFIKVFAKNMGTCPPWHIGAGGKAWVFIDEITVE